MSEVRVPAIAPPLPPSVSPRARAAFVRFVMLALAFAFAVLLWRTRLLGLATSSAWLVGIRDRLLAPGPVSSALLVGGVFALARAHVAALARRSALALFLGYVASLGLYWGNAMMSDGTLLTALERFEYAHGEFSELAMRRRGHLVETLQQYESLVATRSLGMYPPSKPPGIFLVYGGLDALAATDTFQELAAPMIEVARTRPRIRGYEVPVVAAMVMFPLIFALGYPLLYAVVRALRGTREQASFAAAVWATCPAPLIFNFNADNAVYPALGLLATWLLLEGLRRDDLVRLALGGLVFGLALYITYSLLPLVPVFFLLALARMRDRRSPREWARAIGAVAFFGAFAILFQVGCVALLHYEPWHRLPRALEYHRRWKVDCIGGFLCGGTGLGEFTVFVAPPLVVTVLVAMAFVRREATRLFGIVPVVLVALIFALAWTNGTNEVGRIWAFLVPFLALVAGVGAPLLGAGTLGLDGSRGRTWIAALVASQLLLLPLIRASESW